MSNGDVAAGYWRDQSHDYDDRYRNPTTILEHEKVARMETALDLATVRPGAVVGDVGVGAGHLFGRLPSSVERTIGVDFSSHMIDTARTNQPDVEYVQGSVHTLPLESESIDLLFCLGVVGHMNPDHVSSAIEEIRRVVAPGGQFLLSFANARSPFRKTRNAYMSFVADVDVDYTEYAPGYIEALLQSNEFSITSRKYLTYSTGLANTPLNLWAYKAGESLLRDSGVFGSGAMTWVLHSVRDE